MIDESDKSPMIEVAGAEAEETKSSAEKTRRPRRRKPAEQKDTVSKASVVKSQATRPRRYSDEEKAGKLKKIEAMVAEGSSTLKQAIKDVGISEQTFYQWKKLAKPAGQTVASTGTVDEFADLVELEAENLRLRRLLSEKLRTENADLRKRLRLD